MEAAGAGGVRAITRRWAPRPTVVLCGPGNNGGDGFVIARRLRQAGAWDVRLALLGSPDRLHGNARVMADSWDGDMLPLDPKSTEGAALIVDAIFGAGLSRDLDGITRATLESANAADAVRVAVDVPSGIHGDTGHECGYCFRADLSVTFFRKKPGHLLLPDAWCVVRSRLSISEYRLRFWKQLRRGWRKTILRSGAISFRSLVSKRISTAAAMP